MIDFAIKSVLYLGIVVFSLFINIQLFKFIQQRRKDFELPFFFIPQLLLLIPIHDATSNLLLLQNNNFNLGQIFLYFLLFSVLSFTLSYSCSLGSLFIINKVLNADKPMNDLTKYLVLLGFTLLLFPWLVTLLEFILPYPALIYK
jgi:hypothetical protein